MPKQTAKRRRQESIIFIVFRTGPFLRRQESHSVVHATIGKNPPFRRQLTPPLAAYDCEIPAYAGMVLWGMGDCG